MDGGAWWAAVHEVAKSRTWLSNFTFTFHFHALEKEMATHSSVLSWWIPGTGKPCRRPSMGSHRVGHDWSDLAAATAAEGYSISENDCRFFLDTGWFFVSFFFLREFIAKSRPSAGYIKTKSEFPFSSKRCKVFPYSDRHLELSAAASVGWALPAFFLSPLLHSLTLPLYLCKHWSSSPTFCFLWLSTG